MEYLFSQVREKSGNFFRGQENFEMTWKCQGIVSLREFENQWPWQSSKSILILSMRKDCYQGDGWMTFNFARADFFPNFDYHNTICITFGKNGIMILLLSRVLH